MFYHLFRDAFFFQNRDLTWQNTLGATDLAFWAVVQGEQRDELYVQGNQVEHTGGTDPYMKCEFWNGAGHTSEPSRNACYSYSDTRCL